MCQEKKEEEESPALKIASMYQYKDCKTILKLETRNSTDSIMINRTNAREEK